MVDIFKKFIGQEVLVTLRNGKEYVGILSYLPQDDYPYHIESEPGHVMSFKPNGCFYVESTTGCNDAMKIEPMKKKEKEKKNIFEEFVGKKVIATQRDGKTVMGVLGFRDNSKYRYTITQEDGSYPSYTPEGKYWGYDSDDDIVKVELVDIFKEFIGKKVTCTRRDGRVITGVVDHDTRNTDYPYRIIEETQFSSTYAPDGRFWIEAEAGVTQCDIVKLELTEGKWGRVINRPSGVGIEWSNPLDGKEEEFLQVLRDCYGSYPNAENQIIERIKRIWE